MNDDRDRQAAGMVATMEPLAIKTWLMVQADRQYAEDMRHRLNNAWAEQRAGNGLSVCEINDYLLREQQDGCDGDDE
ncbi:hypothetical protein [Thioalkalivibrio sp. ARh3]|uniref:hypothetical protein n=1 Tax=Thioalkalivibrio sp. ARh3 TaxID=1158148 RepID=UPI000372E9EB|nr:hypothetical protein [Thioalkalivibrio sp. ARh3]